MCDPWLSITPSTSCLSSVVRAVAAAIYFFKAMQWREGQRTWRGIQSQRTGAAEISDNNSTRKRYQRIRYSTSYFLIIIVFWFFIY